MSAVCGLMTRPGCKAVFYPCLFGTVNYYASLACCGEAVIDTYARYDKRRKQTHRYAIADTRGVLQLTVPVAKPASMGATWRDIAISDHAHWWNVHRTSLESAYGRTPFFEFYIDRFLPLLQPQGAQGMPADVGSLIEKADKLVRDILGIETKVRYCLADTDIVECTPSVVQHTEEYYQVRAAVLGFIPDLSILDLIFNMGTEAPLVLKRIIDKM